MSFMLLLVYQHVMMFGLTSDARLLRCEDARRALHIINTIDLLDGRPLRWRVRK